MSWKNFLNQFRESEPGESHFILGVDLGEDSSVIAYYDVNRAAPEIIDISGGYGKPSVPTAMQYIPETKEWIFGEYAVLNTGNGEVYKGLLEKLVRGDYVDAGGKPVSAVNVLGMYIRELIGSCRNINPKAEIAGAVFAVPSYLSEEARESMRLAVRAAGYEKALIGLFSDRECIFNHYYSKNGIDFDTERVLLFDFAGREFRGGIYEVTPDGDDVVNIVSISSLFDKELGAMRINEAVYNLFTRFYCENMKITPQSLPQAVKEQLAAFTHQHKDLLFARNERDAAKPVKLYFNFAYPPFQRTVTAAELDEFIKPFKDKMSVFFQNVFKRTLMPDNVLSNLDINTVLCTGGGFEMVWAKRLAEESFPNSRVIFNKNSKGITAEGACLAAAGRLTVGRELIINMSDFHKLKSDVGIMAVRDRREKFVPLAEVNSFWWQPREQRAFIVNEPTSGEDLRLEIVRRGGDGRFVPLGVITLDGLPERPEGTTRLGITFAFPSYDVITAEVRDLGFGELFPAVEYSREFRFAYV
jgi:molecular chaperone DnaK (HSP70)